MGGGGGEKGALPEQGFGEAKRSSKNMLHLVRVNGNSPNRRSLFGGGNGVTGVEAYHGSNTGRPLRCYGKLTGHCVAPYPHLYVDTRTAKKKDNILCLFISQ